MTAANPDVPESTPQIVTVWQGFDYSFSPVFGGRSWRIVIPFPWFFEPDAEQGVILRSLWTDGPRLGPGEALSAARENRHGFRMADETKGDE